MRHFAAATLPGAEPWPADLTRSEAFAEDVMPLVARLPQWHALAAAPRRRVALAEVFSSAPEPRADEPPFEARWVREGEADDVSGTWAASRWLRQWRTQRSAMAGGTAKAGALGHGGAWAADGNARADSGASVTGLRWQGT